MLKSTNTPGPEELLKADFKLDCDVLIRRPITGRFVGGVSIKGDGIGAGSEEGTTDTEEVFISFTI